MTGMSAGLPTFMSPAADALARASEVVENRKRRGVGARFVKIVPRYPARPIDLEALAPNEG